MRTAQELTGEVRRIRERARSLSGFWISEFAAAIDALEWALGKRDKPPSEDVGSPAGEHGKIAERLLEAVSKEAKKPSKPSKPAEVPKPKKR
jgi:hypothetical protein